MGRHWRDHAVSRSRVRTHPKLPFDPRGAWAQPPPPCIHAALRLLALRISLTTSADEVSGDGVAQSEQPPVEDMTLKEGAVLLGGGLFFGAFLALGTKLIQTM